MTKHNLRWDICYLNVIYLSWQEPEEELNKLLLMTVSGRNRNVKAKDAWLC